MDTATDPDGKDDDAAGPQSASESSSFSPSLQAQLSDNIHRDREASGVGPLSEAQEPVAEEAGNLAGVQRSPGGLGCRGPGPTQAGSCFVLDHEDTGGGGARAGHPPPEPWPVKF
jgi:hypothetical protein